MGSLIGFHRTLVGNVSIPGEMVYLGKGKVRSPPGKKERSHSNSALSLKFPTRVSKQQQSHCSSNSVQKRG
jgi:hypothetical protein